jgi:hypothetical protein
MIIYENRKIFMTGLLGKEQECCTDVANLVEVTRKRSSRLGGLGAKYCSDIQIWTPWPNDRRQKVTATVLYCVITTRDFEMDGLSGSLRQLQSQQAESEDFTLIEDHPKRSISRDGYGFRRSGTSTPVSTDGPQLANELVPDPNGLGWPGVFLLLTLQYYSLIA